MIAKADLNFMADRILGESMPRRKEQTLPVEQIAELEDLGKCSFPGRERVLTPREILELGEQKGN